MLSEQTKHLLKPVSILTFLFLSLYSGLSAGVETSAEHALSTLYSNIKEERILQRKEDKEREALFKQQKQEQENKLASLKAELASKEKALKSLKQVIAQADKATKEAKFQLDERSHALKDLFSVWKQAVKDGKSNIESSIIYHQFPNKISQFEQLSTQSSLPDSQDLKAIFKLLQHDIHQNGRHSSYRGELIAEDGQSKQANIQRIGTFSTTSEGKFLLHSPPNNTLITLAAQPEDKVLKLIDDETYKTLQAGNTVNVVIDPSKGLILEQLALIPSWKDRFHQGGYIGYMIVTLGALGLLLSLFRWTSISYSQIAIRRQMKSPSVVDQSNPLGRIIHAYQESIEHMQGGRRKNDKVDNETLEVQLQEIVMSEMPKLDRGLGTIKLLAAIAPLLGLLGTVVGMINTFQSITLVGNADPKLMAGGISQALMTTVMGLLVAVPLLFAHNLLAAKTKKVVMFLTQQSLGFIVKYMKHEDSDSKPSSQTTDTSRGK